MARRRSLVKRLSAVESLGATTVICTDKTGTLTENRMAARAAWVSGAVTELPDGAAFPEEIAALFRSAVLASTATADHGDPTETAIVRAAVDRGIDPEALRAATPLIRPHPSIVPQADDSSETPPAPPACRSAQGDLALRRSASGATRPSPRRGAPRTPIRPARRGRAPILAVAERAIPRELSPRPEGIERLTLRGLSPSGIRPVPRCGAIAPAAARDPRDEITGDYGLTARAIARQTGLSVRQVVTGEELDRLSPESLRALVAEPGVLFARTSPTHKLAIVSALRAAGHVVAVTGDGVNDAPALKAADTGVAMGLRGSEVAKEAAVMVITDDNFASIVEAIREGRAIYDNMGKFVTYIFASNVPELLPFLVSVLFGLPLPLTVMQILAVDLGTDMIPALALGAEPPEPA
jgi:magnesium-transporting ATPase (P-type)